MDITPIDPSRLEAVRQERKLINSALDRIERILAGEIVISEPDDVDQQILKALIDAHDWRTSDEVFALLPKIHWSAVRNHLKTLEASGRVRKSFGKSTHAGGRRPHIWCIAGDAIDQLGHDDEPADEPADDGTVIITLQPPSTETKILALLSAKGRMSARDLMNETSFDDVQSIDDLKALLRSMRDRKLVQQCNAIFDRVDMEKMLQPAGWELVK